MNNQRNPIITISMHPSLTPPSPNPANNPEHKNWSKGKEQHTPPNSPDVCSTTPPPPRSSPEPAKQYPPRPAHSHYPDISPPDPAPTSTRRPRRLPCAAPAPSPRQGPGCFHRRYRRALAPVGLGRFWRGVGGCARGGGSRGRGRRCRSRGRIGIGLGGRRCGC